MERQQAMGKVVEVRVLVVDDDFFARSDLLGRLARHSRVRVVGEADGPEPALSLLHSGQLEAQPQVILVDLAYEQAEIDMAHFIAEACKLIPGVKVLGMSVRQDETLALQAIRAGAAGVVWKNEVRSRICTAVIRTQEGFCMFTAGVVARLCGQDRLLPDEVRVVGRPEDRQFTPRVSQVARLWCEEGMSAREIAQELHLTVSTIRGYVKEIYQVLGVADRPEGQESRQSAYESQVDGTRPL